MKTSVSVYLSCCLVFWLSAATVLMLVDKASLHLALQLPHTAFNDMFFRTYSSFAEWLLYVIMALPLLAGLYVQFVQKRRDGTSRRLYLFTGLYAAAEILTALVVQAIKHIVNAPRPMTFFTEEFGSAAMLPLVDGVRMHSWYSFPSGHTATFFAFFTASLAILMSLPETEACQTGRNGTLRYVVLALACFFLALMGGYSRIYLSQHFLLDVFVGSVIGTLVTFAVIALFRRRGWL